MISNRGCDTDKPLKRIREWMDVPGRYDPGPRNSISDVVGVQVGHCTLVEGDSIRTGVTIIRPLDGDPYLAHCPCAIYAGNGYGKLTGSLQVDELGELESLIGLTNTLSVAQVMQGILNYHLPSLPESLRSINIVVGETNDGHLSDITRCAVTPDHVRAAIEACSPDVQEGAVGAGTGTVCFGYKGGIGTASRVVSGARTREPADYCVGALVQSNYGGNLSIYGHPIPQPDPYAVLRTAGSCMIVVATDAPVDSRQLTRFARRGIVGLERTGSYLSHYSGDFCIAFSNCKPNLRPLDAVRKRTVALLADGQLSPFFEAIVEAVAEALYNSMTMSPTTAGFRGHRIEGLNLAQFADLLPLKSC